MREKIEIYILSAITFSSFVSSVLATLIVMYDPAINGRHEEFDYHYVYEVFGVYFAFFTIPMIWFGSILFVFMFGFTFFKIFSSLFAKGR